jgi:glycosyltransferase involved in cell wall biosynthesis
MNIAIFASAFHPHFGGVEELVRQLSLQLRRLGHCTIVLSNRWPRTLPSHEVFEGIPVYRVPFRTPDAGAKSAATYTLTRNTIDREVRGILQRHNIEVIHVQCVSSNGYYAERASRRLGLPLVVTLQGELTMDATGLFERSEFARKTLRTCVDAADMVTACSRRTLEDGERFFGQSLGGRARVIYNGARIEDFSSAVQNVHKRPYIFAIGRLVHQKGFDVLLRAFAAAEVPDHDLLLAGDGPERGALTALSSQLGIDERVKFLGVADRSTVPGLFAGCDWFVLPSRADEGLPVVAVEAMAARKAVVATRSGGTPEAVLDAATGLLVEKEDVAGLAHAMSRLAMDVGLRRRLADAGRERAAEFAWPVIADSYLDIYRQVTARSELPGAAA